MSKNTAPTNSPCNRAAAFIESRAVFYQAGHNSKSSLIRGHSTMPKRSDIDTVVLLGAGPIVIGQACEFDYSGTQACKTLRKKAIGWC